MPELAATVRLQLEKRYVLVLSICLAVVLSFPWLYAHMVAPTGSSYTGFEYNADDQMVYAAWMRQASDGHLMMDNRFAVEPQPGLTINVFFFALGLLAKVLTIPVAVHAARIGLSVLLVFLLHGLIRRVTKDVYTTKLALTLTVLGGGLGFLVWHNYGQVFTKPTPLGPALSPLLGGGLPTDVWQPEGFVFPSMLTNALFVAALCLIVFTFTCFLDARDNKRAVLPGAIAFGVLMNIHSYDALLVAIVMVGFLVACLAQKSVTGAWVGRAALIGCGAVPAALWFVHVLQNDPVFQARAATETYSPNFRQLVFGYLVMILLAFVGIAMRKVGKRPLAGLAVVGALIVGLFLLATRPYEGYFLSMAVWGAVVLVGLGAIWLLSGEEPAWNLLISWAVLGLVAPYFPALFQRKLTMGLSIPWAILASVGLAAAGAKLDRQARNLVTVLGLVLLSGTSLFWVLLRDRTLISTDVSNTTMHPVFLSTNESQILDYLNSQKGRIVAVARPGISVPAVAGSGEVIPDVWQPPYIPDLNPFLSGFAGAYTYAGHWSETPDYLGRRGLAVKIFDVWTSPEQRRALLAESGATYLVAPVPEAFPEANLADLRSLGEVAVDGPQFRLIRLR